MRRLDQYRNMEDHARADSAEGLGNYRDENGIEEHFELGNSIYVLCCSDASVDLSLLREKMGPHIVRISDAAQLAADIGEYLHEQKMRIFGAVRCRAVEYTKGAVVQCKLDKLQRAELSIIQKPPSFSDERERRFYFILNVNPPSCHTPAYLDINIGRRLPYIELIETYEDCGSR